MSTITSLFRYPIKGLSGQPLTRVALSAGQGFPKDRQWAVTNGSARFDAANPAPMPKTDFVMLMKHERIAMLRASFDDEDDTLRIDWHGQQVLEAPLSTPEGRLRVEVFYAEYMQGQLDGVPRLVSRPGHRFTDVSVVSPSMMNAVSLINLASVRALEAATGQPMDPLRFRANIYFDSGTAWEEFDWMDRDILLGKVPAKVVFRTRRCAATNVNPLTAERDRAVPLALLKHFKHGDLGVYAEVCGSGSLDVGDTIRLQP